MGGVTAVAVTTNGFDFTAIRTTLQLADRYLSEQNYEQAIIEFEKVLEIEPMNVDAYLGLAEAYMALGETDKVIKILEKGIGETNSDKLRDKLDKIRESINPATAEAEITNAETIEPAETVPEETETVTEAATEPPSINIPDDIAVIGGVEYSLDLVTIEGELLNQDQLADFSVSPDIKCSSELLDIFKEINHPEFSQMSVNASVLNTISSIGKSIDKLQNKLFLNEQQYLLYNDTKYSVTSFYTFCLDNVTEKMAESILNSKMIAIYNGQIWIRDAALGGPFWIYNDYELKNNTDDEIEIHITNYSGYDSGYDPNKKDEYDINEETIKFVLTDKGWRVSEVPIIMYLQNTF